jgi:murein DD-endopeptidase MepM/ murein hydrolase activator NlpD
MNPRLAVVGVVVPLLMGPVCVHAASDAPMIAIGTAARALQPGELVVVTLTPGPDAADVQVTVFGRSVVAFSIGANRWQALVGIDLEQPPGTYTITAGARRGDVLITGTRTFVVQPKTFATRTLRVAPEFVNPPPFLQERIDRETALLRQVYARSAPERLWQAGFTRPVPQPASSRFGTRSVFNGEPRSPHAGTDFLSGTGTPVKAPNAGRIVVARDLFFSGNTVIIDHGLEVFSVLAHLSRIDVSEGDLLDGGQIVGLVGATGRVTGAHLHWALRVGGARVDPLSLLRLLGS